MACGYIRPMHDMQVLPILLEELKTPAMAPYVLPSLFAIVDTMPAAEFEQFVSDLT